MWEKFLKEWYVLNKSQRRGTLFLIVLLFCSILLKVFYFPSIDSDAVYFANIIVDNATLSDTTAPDHSTKLKRKDSLFFFNPNVASVEELQMLGLPEKIIHNITKYREAGGIFYTKESLKKIYSMTDSIYQKIEPYILINHSSPSKNSTPFSQNKFNHSAKQVLTLELNTADSSALEKLKGIGKVLAARIIKYRNRLGGFYSVEQLKEVYGLKDSLYVLVVRENKLLVDTTLIQKIDIRQADFKTMIRHPYFTKEIVIKILEMQRKKEPLNNHTLQKIMTPYEWNRLRYYILWQ